MSTVSADRTRNLERSRGRGASVGFVLLLALALFWPAPVVELNDAFLDAPIAVDEDSFLGREAPSWDVVFWCIAGLFTLALFHGRASESREGWKGMLEEIADLPSEVTEGLKRLSWRAVILRLMVSAAIVALAWFFLDSRLMMAAEAAQSETTRWFTRIFNRLGGGMNPALVVGFFGVAGVALARRRWISLSLAMLLSGVAGGVIAQLIKLVVGRSRPELWFGPFHHARAAASSFPSGHTVGAFALAGVVMLGSKSRPMKFVAMLLASAIGISRVMAFRHWPSDVIASAIVGLALAWFFTSAIVEKNGRGDSSQG